MNEMFSQGGKGSTGILTNKQAVARHFGVKQSEVVYFSVGALLDGYKVIYDKGTQRAYSLPADLGSGITAISLTPAGVLVHSVGSVDLGALAVTREEYVTLPGSFNTGVVVNTKNELVVFTDGKYRWDGALPKVVPAGSTPDSTGEVKLGAWVGVGVGVPVLVRNPKFETPTASYAPNFSDASYISATVTGDVTITPEVLTNILTGYVEVLLAVYSTTSKTITFGANVKLASNTPSLTSSGTQVFRLSTTDGGATWFCKFEGAYS